MTDLNFKVIGKKIKERRLSLNITQEYIANKLDVNASHISNIKCGRANPSLTILIKIANILKCSVDYFISGEYTFDLESVTAMSLDEQIIKKLEYCDIETKQKILQIIDIL